ncbi:MAG TPA: DEAD/DEAH box helicase [Planctomycetota bacterium]|jgi:superfamily II DNA or RNA helicase
MIEAFAQTVSKSGPMAAKKSKGKPAKTPRTHKPDHMTLEEWQVALRREFGRDQKFRLKNTGDHPLFSEFQLFNPATERTYRVVIRSNRLGDNFCSCPDFSVNTLGTCKHIEFTLARLGRNRSARKALNDGFHPAYSEVFLRHGARREVVFRPGTEITAEARAALAKYFDGAGILRPDAFSQFDALMAAFGKDHEIRIYDDALAYVAQVRDRAQLAERVEALFADGVKSAAFESLLKVPLYAYQRAGALFAAKAGRALIADDMGLGKTIQAIAAAEILARAAGVERVLVVAPTSLKHQWKQEIEKFTGRTAEVIEGMLAVRSEKYAASSFYKIVNYDVIHRDTEAIRRWAPDLVILDEAQRIKNWKTRAARTVKQLPSQYAIVLTGTPLENRLEELHSIVEFVDRFRLGPMFRFLAEHQQTDGDGRVIGYRNLDRISQTLKTILIRRVKADVLKELPARLEKHFFVPMTPQQWEYHEENREIVARIVHKWRKHRFLSDADQKRMTCALQNMRMSCNSTYLLDPATDYGVKADEISMLLEEWLERREAKAVVFSQWVRSHELLAARLKKRGLEFVLFHGGVPGPKRKDLIARFRDDDRCRVFLSTDAGGVGLNLQHASAVINVDQPWNPAVLEQRIGRVHRLGQKRPVQVAHFVAESTIEHSMLGLLKFKKSLFSGVLDGGEREVFLGGTRLTKFMESVDRATQSIPAAPPEPAIPAAESEAQQISGEADDEPATTPAAAAAPAPAAQWQNLIASGRALLDGLERVVSAAQQPATPGAPAPASPLVETDARTGQSYLKLPMPSPETVQKIAALLQRLLGAH